MKYHPLVDVLYMFYLFFIEAYVFVSLYVIRLKIEEIQEGRKKGKEEG
jgi:hypothetical protein